MSALQAIHEPRARNCPPEWDCIAPSVENGMCCGLLKATTRQAELSTLGPARSACLHSKQFTSHGLGTAHRNGTALLRLSRTECVVACSKRLHVKLSSLR